MHLYKEIWWRSRRHCLCYTPPHTYRTIKHHLTNEMMLNFNMVGSNMAYQVNLGVLIFVIRSSCVFCDWSHCALRLVVGTSTPISYMAHQLMTGRYLTYPTRKLTWRVGWGASIDLNRGRIWSWIQIEQCKPWLYRFMLILAFVNLNLLSVNHNYR